MWPFVYKQAIIKSGLLVGSSDFHSHILPGVDDGVRSMNEALEILDNFEKQKIAELWLTPHVMEDIPNTTNALTECFAHLQAEYKGNIKLYLAAEYMLDALFDERLAKNDLLPLGEQGNHILVETSYFSPPIGLYDIFALIKSKGYYPVLAHPERYQYMNKADYIKLKAEGIKFQLNWASLAGRYGRREQKKAEWLVKKNMYNIVGSDTHRLTMRHWEIKIETSIAQRIKVSPILLTRL